MPGGLPQIGGIDLRKHSWTIVFLLICLSLGGCSTPPSSSLSPSVSPSPISDLENLDFNTFVEKSFLRLIQREPEYMITTERGGWGNLNDLSDRFLRETQALEVSVLNLLRQYDVTQLNPEQQLTAKAYDWYLDDRVAGHPYLYSDYSFNPTVFSQHYQLEQFFTDLHPLETEAQCESYLQCLSQVQRKCEQMIEGLKRREQAGVILPRPLFAPVIYDLETMANSDPAATIFYQTLVSKTANGPLSWEKRDQLLQNAAKAIEQSVLPGYRALLSYCEELAKRAPEKIGIGSLTNGPAYYETLLHHYTSTDLSAEEIHDLGIQQLERVQKEMRTRFAEMGYPTGKSLPELFARLTQEQGVYSGSEVLATARDLVREAEARVQTAIDLPSNFPMVEIKPSTMGNFYTSGTPDHPGIFYAGGQATRYGLPATVYHETIPGHHLQLSMMFFLSLPACRLELSYVALEEGWALYAEQLSSELGWFEGDPAGELGRLQLEALRAARLVVDTGIHAKGWTWEQAKTYLIDALGYSEDDAEQGVARFSSIPGQATAYMVGMLKILELRERAKTALGDRFDLKQFHNQILGKGKIPLSLLEQVVEDWIQQKLLEPASP
jgi:uncharacterized protein (DUF885 family)